MLSLKALRGTLCETEVKTTPKFKTGLVMLDLKKRFSEAWMWSSSFFICYLFNFLELLTGC